MSILDQETIILINENDWKEGFFCFSTTRLNHYNRLIRLIGGHDKLRSFKTNSQGGRVIEWLCQVPIEFISKRSWKIGRKAKRVMSDEQKIALAERLKESRTKKEIKNG